MVAIQDIAPVDYSYNTRSLLGVSIYMTLLRQAYAWACWNKGTKQKIIFTQANLKVMPPRDMNWSSHLRFNNILS
jgi:hypothetical protein